MMLYNITVYVPAIVPNNVASVLEMHTFLRNCDGVFTPDRTDLDPGYARTQESLDLLFTVV